MSKKEIKNIPASIHARLLNKARVSGRPFNEILQYFMIERFLYRLAQSPYENQFVLKGAILFRAWGMLAFRPTRDIDLLGRTSNKIDNIIDIIQKVCEQKVQDDGICFDPKTVTGERIKEGADYEGIRVHFVGFLGRARANLQIDIGFGDIVYPTPEKVKYPVILPVLPKPELHGYPRETVIAEKVKAMIHLGSVNSRMKDFYDLWVLTSRFEFSGSAIQRAIQKTFLNRETNIPKELPPAFSVQFGKDKQDMWDAFIKTSRVTNAPNQLETVLIQLKKFILPIFQCLHAGKIFNKMWHNGQGWK